MPKVVISNIPIPKGSIKVGDGTQQRATCPIGANGTVLTADDTKPCGVDWKTPSGGGTTIKQAILDFSYPPQKTKVFNVVEDTAILTSKILVFSGNNDLDINDESFNYNINPKSGSFDITLTGETPIGGNFKINYICQ